MALLGQNLDYSSKDFDSLRARLINLVRATFPEWTDFNVANFGNILLELYAFIGDVLGFYQDNQARESRISTAQLRRSMLGLVKLISYRPTGATAARVDLTITLDAVPAADVPLAAADTFRTKDVTDPVVFQLLENATIPAGAIPPSIVLTVEHSEFAQDVFQSASTPNQEFQLSQSPYLDGTLAVVAYNGIFTEVADFFDSTATSAHYTVTVDEYDRAIIRFGNGVNGLIPTGQIVCDYKTGGGEAGNVEPNTVVRPGRTTYQDTLEGLYRVSVTNTDRGEGGYSRETVEHMRVAAPRSLRALTRSVAREDFEINAMRVPGIERALMLTSDQMAGIPENRGWLYIVPEGAGNPTQDQIDAVTTMVTVTYPHTLTFLVTVYGANYVDVNVLAVVHFVPGAVPADVVATIRANLVAFFALTNNDGSPNTNIDFGYQMGGLLAYSDVYNVVHDTVGVLRMDDNPSALQLNDNARDLDLQGFEFPRLGTLTVYDAATQLIVT